jgi:hypothetical protein
MGHHKKSAFKSVMKDIGHVAKETAKVAVKVAPVVAKDALKVGGGALKLGEKIGGSALNFGSGLEKEILIPALIIGGLVVGYYVYTTIKK